MAAIFQPDYSKNYAYLAALGSRLAQASDDEVIAAIRSECNPERIRKGARAVAVLGGIIHEAGKRKLTAAAPLIVEYCAWPVFEDFWVHVVPKALRAIKTIGDLSIVPRLRVIAKDHPETRSWIDPVLLTLTRCIPEIPVAPVETVENLDIFASTPVQAALVLEASRQGLCTIDDIVAWADRLIVQHPDPPLWLIDVSTANFRDSRDYWNLLAPHAAVLPARQRLQVIVLPSRAGLLSLPRTLRNLFGWFCSEPHGTRGGQSDNLLQLLQEAVDEWVFQEDEKAWSKPDALDEAGKALHARLMAFFDAILENSAFCAQVLGWNVPGVASRVRQCENAKNCQ